MSFDPTNKRELARLREIAEKCDHSYEDGEVFQETFDPDLVMGMLDMLERQDAELRGSPREEVSELMLSDIEDRARAKKAMLDYVPMDPDLLLLLTKMVREAVKAEDHVVMMATAILKGRHKEQLVTNAWSNSVMYNLNRLWKRAKDDAYDFEGKGKRGIQS